MIVLNRRALRLLSKATRQRSASLRRRCTALDRSADGWFPERGAFTLVEILVVIAIIGVLVGLLLPAVQAAREAARRAQCNNNLKQLGLACQSYADIHGGFPLLYSSSNQPGWVTQVLPYFEQGNLLTQYNYSQPWFDASNAAVVAQRIPILECPTSPLDHVYTATDPGFAGKSANPLTTFTTASTSSTSALDGSTAAGLTTGWTTASGATWMIGRARPLGAPSSPAI